MKIGGFQKQSLVDYPEKICSIIFTVGCNFRCPYCHNQNLLVPEKTVKEIPEEEVLSYLRNNKKFLDAAEITGGEPTLHKDLPEFIQKIRELGLLIKLDTSGTNFEMLKKLLDDNLLDYVAMDIKAPIEFHKYNKATGGILTEKLFSNVKKSILLLLNSGIQYEFRTTFVPGLLTKKDVIKICSFIKNANQFSLQQFNPENTLDKKFQKLKPFEENEIISLIAECKHYIQNSLYR